MRIRPPVGRQLRSVRDATKGCDRIHHRHKDDADEKQLRQREMQKMKEKSDRGRQRQLQLESDYNIIELKDTVGQGARF